MKLVTAGGRALAKAGFQVLREVKLTWALIPGKWYEALTPQGEEVVVLRQSPHRWHVFYAGGGTASGGDPISALHGGLGDVIDTDAQLKSYCKMVLDAPQRLLEKNDGLYQASSECFQEMGLQL